MKTFSLVFRLSLISVVSAGWFEQEKTSCNNEGKELFSLIISKESEMPYTIHNVFECNLQKVLDNIFNQRKYKKGKFSLKTNNGTPEYIKIANLLSIDYYYSYKIKTESTGIGFFSESYMNKLGTVVHIMKPNTAGMLNQKEYKKGSKVPGFKSFLYKN